MSGFIRPELDSWLRRWAEPLVALALGALGGWLVWRGSLRVNLVAEGVGVLLLVAGLLLFLAAYRRARFRMAGGGPGLVDVTERQITFLTPFGGGAVALDALVRIEIRRHGPDDRVWVLSAEDGSTLAIPLSATGAEALFDAFAVLEGLDLARLLAAQHARKARSEVIWTAPGRFPALT